MNEIKNGQNNEPSQIWMCLGGKALPIKEPKDTPQREDLRGKVEENESFTDQMEVMMQYLQASIRMSNQNAIILSKVLENQKKFAEEKVLAQYFAKMNKILDFEKEKQQTRIQRTSQKLDKMNSNLINKKGTFEDLEGLGFVLDVNSDLWKRLTQKIKETGGLEERIKVVEKEKRKIRDKQKIEENFRRKFAEDLDEVKKQEKEGQARVLEECLREMKKGASRAGEKIEGLSAKVDNLRENYNWRIEDLNTKLDNRVDLQQLETTVESLHSGLFSQNQNPAKNTSQCGFLKDSVKVGPTSNQRMTAREAPRLLSTPPYRKDSFCRMPRLMLWKTK